MRKTFSIALEGKIPSKKNAWKRASSGRVFIDPGMKLELDGLCYQIIRERNRLRMVKPFTGSFRVEATFKVESARCDLDNMFTTLLDLLQRSLIIDNDKHVVEIHAKRIITTIPGAVTDVTVRVL